ncbi:MAG: hypothetical protein FK733_02260 [Asgard group archaeon]|nr:hypothetical protein [Asgard group archaeon]
MVLPIATIVSVTSDDTTEIDFIIYLRSEHEQYLVDSLFASAESIGLTVNPMYLSWDDWLAADDAGAYDISYGGIQIAYNIDTIINLVYCTIGLEWMVLKHSDAKLSKFVNQLFNYYISLQTTADEDLPDLLADMLNKFNDVEERLWEKQLIIPLAQWLNPYLACNSALFINSQEGNVFADEDLRFSLASAIDRSLFVDYWSAILPFPVYEVYHMYLWSSFHNFNLPNCVPS